MGRNSKRGKSNCAPMEKRKKRRSRSVCGSILSLAPFNKSKQINHNCRKAKETDDDTLKMSHNVDVDVDFDYNANHNYFKDLNIEPIGQASQNSLPVITNENAQSNGNQSTALEGQDKLVSLLDESYREKIFYPVKQNVLPRKRSFEERRMSRVKLLPSNQPLPIKFKKKNEMLESHPNHLPFFAQNRYNRGVVLRRIARCKEMRNLISGGRYYIEKDWKDVVSPWIDQEEYSRRIKEEEKKRKKNRASGRYNRIVDLFMEEVLNWTFSREMYATTSHARLGNITLLWLGRSLAKRVINEVCYKKETSKIFEETRDDCESEFYIVNRLPLDIFFNDKEALFYMLRGYMLSPSLSCKDRSCARKLETTVEKRDEAAPNCRNLEYEGYVTRNVCVHQNLSMSLKPCTVENCKNKGRVVCDHIYAFIPETIPINTYSSMLHFNERFQRVEELKGCIFVTKPAYLNNSRGIKFFVNKSDFEYFFHLARGKQCGRHGVQLQRYIECPRLFNGHKFTIRFFILIIVLPYRRVLAFIHYGIAFFAKKPYEFIQRESFDNDEELLEGKKPDPDVPVQNRTIGRVTTAHFDKDVHITNYICPKERKVLNEKIVKGQVSMMDAENDCAHYISELLPQECENSMSIYIQMLFVAQCMLNYMQPIVQDYPGAFQTVAVDCLIDARNKLWVLGAGTNIFSSMLTIAPKQREMMSAIMQEILGITTECFYKSRKKLPLFTESDETPEKSVGFFFSSDFHFFYETEINKQTDYIAEKKRISNDVMLEERYDQVDRQMEAVKARKRENEARKRKIIKAKQDYLARVRAKDDEES